MRLQSILATIVASIAIPTAAEEAAWQSNPNVVRLLEQIAPEAQDRAMCAWLYERCRECSAPPSPNFIPEHEFFPLPLRKPPTLTEAQAQMLIELANQWAADNPQWTE